LPFQKRIAAPGNRATHGTARSKDGEAYLLAELPGYGYLGVAINFIAVTKNPGGLGKNRARDCSSDVHIDRQVDAVIKGIVVIFVEFCHGMQTLNEFAAAPLKVHGSPQVFGSGR
jgi:hypothetical protein